MDDVALGLDVGERRIGVAVAQAGFVFPVETLERTNVRDDVARIVALAAERNATVMVVGDPIDLKGERGLAARTIDAFVEHLARRWSQPIERVDERMTTAAATRALIAADVSRKKRRGVVDQMAAVLILETWQARRNR